jgi:hypothetical protein
LRRAAAAAIAQVYAQNQPKPEFFAFGGGWDQISSPLEIAPGRVVSAQNFEAALPRGYQRIKGYERLDGRPRPSDAQYACMDVTITGSIAVGNTVTGGTSAATGVVLAVVAASGSVSAYIVITKIVGTFQSGEAIKVAAVTQATSTSTANVDGASTAKLAAQYKALAADNYRADIGAVPGSGAVRGVFHHNDIRYAFRDNAGGTACALYKSSVSGWTAVNLGRKISWSTAGAGAQINDGDVVTGATSGASGTVTRAMLETGTWASGTGKLIFASVTGAFNNGENLQVGGVTKVVSSSVDSAITLSPGGRYEFVKENFGGLTGTKRVYGCDGVNQGFEFDGSVYCPIRTGMTVDAPTHVGAFRNYLFFSFSGSAQFAGVGTPYIWSVILGAGELAMGDDITGFMVLPARDQTTAAFAIFTRFRINILYGTSSSNWALVPYQEELGAFAYTAQNVGYPMFLQDRGVTDLQRTQAYGNFLHNAISLDVNTFMQEHKTLAVASSICRDKSQYRLFFTDKFALYITAVGKKILGIMPILFNDVVRCAYSAPKLDGSEEMLFGSDNGYVFQMDRGTSFDGVAIDWYFDMPYLFSKSPIENKHYGRGRLEITGTSYAEFTFSFDLAYGSGEHDTSLPETLTSSFSAGRWDTGTWDVGFWDGKTLLPSTFDVSGSGENIHLRIAGSATYIDSFNFHGVVLTHRERRQLRK